MLAKFIIAKGKNHKMDDAKMEMRFSKLTKFVEKMKKKSIIKLDWPIGRVHHYHLIARHTM